MAIRPYLDQINECSEGARRDAVYISTTDMLSIPARAQFARKIVYGTAIAACALFVGALFGHHLYSETATRSVAKPTVDVAALEATIDMKHLQRQAVPSRGLSIGASGVKRTSAPHRKMSANDPKADITATFLIRFQD